MRTAVCISGQPREIVETWEAMFDNLLAWLPNPTVIIHSPAYYPADANFFANFQPALYVVEPQFIHPHAEDIIRRAGYHDENHLNSCVQQFYGLKRVGELKRQCEKATHNKFDLVVRTRPDLLFLKPVTPTMIDLERINTLHGLPHHAVPTEFAAGPSDQMDAYFGCYDWLVGGGEAWLKRWNHRVVEAPGGNYNPDLIMATYLLDCVGLRLAPQLPRGYNPYEVYRIMYRHKLGLY